MCSHKTAQPIFFWRDCDWDLHEVWISYIWKFWTRIFRKTSPVRNSFVVQLKLALCMKMLPDAMVGLPLSIVVTSWGNWFRGHCLTLVQLCSVADGSLVSCSSQGDHLNLLKDCGVRELKRRCQLPPRTIAHRILTASGQYKVLNEWLGATFSIICIRKRQHSLFKLLWHFHISGEVLHGKKVWVCLFELFEEERSQLIEQHSFWFDGKWLMLFSKASLQSTVVLERRNRKEQNKQKRSRDKLGQVHLQVFAKEPVETIWDQEFLTIFERENKQRAPAYRSKFNPRDMLWQKRAEHRREITGLPHTSPSRQALWALMI